MNISYLFSKFLAKLQFASIKNSNINNTAKVYEKCELNKVTLGRYSYIAKNTFVTNACIGNFCSIGSFCSIGGGMHPIEMISSSPCFLKGKNALGMHFANIDYTSSIRVFIGNDVWIGDGVYIKSGIKVGDGAIIGAHSVVTKNVEAYSVVAGVPAKLLYKRFDQRTIDKLIRLEWWNWSDSKLKKYGNYFNNPGNLFTQMENN